MWETAPEGAEEEEGEKWLISEELEEERMDGCKSSMALLTPLLCMKSSAHLESPLAGLSMRDLLFSSPLGQSLCDDDDRLSSSLVPTEALSLSMMRPPLLLLPPEWCVKASMSPPVALVPVSILISSTMVPESYLAALKKLSLSLRNSARLILCASSSLLVSK